MKRFITLSLFFIVTVSQIQAQDHPLYHSSEHGKGFRIAGLIGHTLIKSKGADSQIFIPSWGLDIEYWLSYTWGLGMHNDIEIETFIVKSSDHKEIERVNPLVLTFDALYRFPNGIVLSGGPGVEIESGESFYLCRFGIEYEKEIGNGYDISPTIFYDQRLDGFSTYTVALGIGKQF